MNRLQSELHRLYLLPAPEGRGTDADEAGLIDAQGRVRAMVLELARPADWQVLSKVWQGVQLDLELPAPAIAVSGTDGYQLWFSLTEPVPAQQATAFLDLLRVRYLSEVKPQRVGMMPAVDPLSPPQILHARRVPAPQANAEHWSAFVASDLAPVFDDEPWLDMPPNPDGQRDLLSRLKSMPLLDFERALEQLKPAVMPVHAPPATDPTEHGGATLGLLSSRQPPAGAGPTPQQFLLDVMNNHAVGLGQRIAAAKALLPYFDAPRR